MEASALEFYPYYTFPFYKSDFTEYIRALYAHLNLVKDLYNTVLQIRRDGLQLSDFEALGQPNSLAKYVRGVAGFYIQEVIHELQYSGALQAEAFSGKTALEQTPEEIEIELKLRQAHIAKASKLSNLEQQYRYDRLYELKQRQEMLAGYKQRYIDEMIQKKNNQKLMILNTKQHQYQSRNQRVEAYQKAFKLRCEQEHQKALLTVGAEDEKRFKIYQLNRYKMKEEQLHRKARLKYRAYEKLAMYYAVYGRYSEMADYLMTGSHVE